MLLQEQEETGDTGPASCPSDRRHCPGRYFRQLLEGQNLAFAVFLWELSVEALIIREVIGNLLVGESTLRGAHLHPVFKQ